MAKNISQKHSFPENDEVRDVPRQIGPEAEVGNTNYIPKLSRLHTSTKEQTQIFSRDDKEKTMVQTAINPILVENTATIAKYSITILNDIVCKLNFIDLSSGWIFHKHEPDTLFIHKITTLVNQPCIQCSLVIDKGFLNVL